MYNYFKGILSYIGEDYIVVECNGIGYEIYIPASLISDLPHIGFEMKIYTYLHVREDAMLLYGFLTEDDKRIFKLLIGVNGIGPKGALSILSVLSPDDLRFAILSDDVKGICKAPGIGTKMAQKLILELKDKLSLEEAFESKLSKNVETKKEQLAKTEAVSALVSLGYSSTDAYKAVSTIDNADHLSTEDILKAALKKMAF